VQRKITSLWGEKKVILRQTPRAVTPFGGLSVLIEFLAQIGFREQVRRALPVRLESPNAIDPGETFTAFPISVVAGARRFAHTSPLRADRGFACAAGTVPRPFLTLPPFSRWPGALSLKPPLPLACFPLRMNSSTLEACADAGFDQSLSTFKILLNGCQSAVNTFVVKRVPIGNRGLISWVLSVWQPKSSNSHGGAWLLRRQPLDSNQAAGGFPSAKTQHIHGTHRHADAATDA